MASFDFKSRSKELELMDDLNCSGQVVEQTLRELEFINRTLGGNAVTVQGVMALIGHRSTAVSILDLGCGGGDMLLLLQKKLQSENVPATFLGIDANPHIVDYAIRHCDGNPWISFKAVDIFSKNFKQLKCDVAIATLFLHHFTDEQLVGIFKQLIEQVTIGIVINDLHRHPLAFHSISLLTIFFSKSAMVKYDAPLSVLRGFKKKELTGILDRAGIKKYSIHWRWAFRWQIVITK
jgi:2-polyprenyl-3-methyl-5-hydroxy-6-metoxy-1,4-benzoquinol methylase